MGFGHVTRALRICLAGSGGGHVRQLLDLAPAFGDHDHFFVTEDTALGRTLQSRSRTHFVPHFAWGQGKHGQSVKMLMAAAANFVRSAFIVLRERPDIVISTGAGAVYFTVLWARLAGACVIVVESFARFEAPSLFGRLAASLAHHLVVQSPLLEAFYPRAKVFDPLRSLDTPAPPKKDLLFATVGATLPFDRLVEMVAQMKREGAIQERVLIQTGIGGVAPEGLEVVESLDFDEVQAILRDASIVVCHGGTGSLITAMRQGCHVIAVPRLAAREEHYDDHQSEIVEAFVERKLVLEANTPEELRTALAACRTRDRVLATSDPVQLVEYLKALIARPASTRKQPVV
jgi:UDP-N-acetylglucosamine--N-acetylmuramyl-(pentapeptide) pyrophosphoryl-undecaprenol N-acetylglucosamine transferase